MYSVSKNYSKTSPTFFAWSMGAMDCQATQSLMHKMTSNRIGQPIKKKLHV